MAGGGGGNSRELDQTATWAVASVCVIIVVISMLLEKGLHRIGQWFAEKRKKALFEALEKVKAELMVLGFISLLLTFGQSYIAKICIPESAADTMLLCKLERDNGDQNGSPKRRLLWNEVTNSSSRRILASGVNNSCPEGKVTLVSINGLHQLHIFIFFLAIFHVAYSALTMALGRAKIRRWREWEKETQSIDYEFFNDPLRFKFAQDTTFVKQYTSFWNRIPFFLYIVSFFRQFFRSVSKTDYLAMRHGFINVHLAPGSKFNFQKYIMRSLEDDFKVIVGISPVLWASAVLFLLLNVHGWQEMFWVTLIPPLIILAVGTKLQAIITKMAIEVQKRHAVVQGIPLVQVGDDHFWFGHPRLVLFLIHFTLFQNAFQITYFFWIWYDFGLRSCFHENFKLIIARVCMGAAVQFICSYTTLPLYALVSQMGSHMKVSVFNEQTTKVLKKWHRAVKRRHKKGSQHSPSMTPSTSALTSPRASPLHQFNRSRTLGRSSRSQALSSRVWYHSDHEISDPEAESSIVSPSSTANSIPQLKQKAVEVEPSECSSAVDLKQKAAEVEPTEHVLNEEKHGGEDFTFVNSPTETGEN